MRPTFILLCSVCIFVNCAVAQGGSRLRKGFERLDANKDGQLSATELKTVPRLESRLEGADQDNDGLLSFREFAGAIARSMRRPAQPEEAGGAFGAGDRIRTIDVEGQERRYQVHVPPNYTADRKTPVVVAFHGGGGNPQSMIRLSGLNEKADDAGFVVVYPFGSGADQDKNLTFNAGNVGGYAKRKKIDDVGFTKALLGDLEAVVNVDKERVFATGISNGGMMAYRVASELADRFAAIAPVGGPMGTAECNPASPVSVIHFHGTADELAPFNGGRGKGTSNVPASMRPEFFSVEHSINCWVEANGCAKEPTVTPMPDTTDDGMRVIRKVWGEGKNGSEVVLYEIDGGGHTWPGMEPPVAMLGASTTDISANDLMWDFFQKHAKRAHKVKSADAVHTGLTEEGLSGSVNPRGNVLMYHGPGGAIFEFVEWRQNQQTGSELTRPERLFQRLDADNDGKVTQAEPAAEPEAEAVEAEAAEPEQDPTEDRQIWTALTASPSVEPAANRSPVPAAQKKEAAPESLDLPALLAAEALQTSVVVSDLEKARRFYAEGLGLRSFAQPRRMPDSSMMHIYRAGASAIKLRVYATPPPNRGRAVAAVNGIRFIGVPVAGLTPVLDQLKRLGFTVERESERDGARVAVVADPDGNRLELIEAGEGATRRGIELGLVVDDLAAAKSFAGDVLGLTPLPGIESIVLPGQREVCYGLGQSVIRFLAPPGERQTFEGRPADAIGFRYITHTVRNVTAVFEAMKAHGIKLAGTGKPVRYRQNAVLMAYGPGGGIFEFVGPERKNTGSGMPPALPDNRIESLFRNADRNGDGKLSGNELTQFPSLARILRFADRDQDGALSIEELRTVSARWPGREASPGGTSEAKPAPAGSDKPKDDADKAANKALNLRYHAMDFDGDGVVTQREFPNQTIFKVFDQDRSGEITRTEFVAKLGKSAERGPITPESALVPIGEQVDWFTFKKDYFPGTRDPNGQLLGGTELMWLTAHEGKLFAGTSMLKSDVTVKPYPGYPGPQILRKDRGDGPWIAEESFGRDHLRINCLEVLRFTEDPDGKPLPKPVSLLAAGLYDIRRGEKWLTVAVRNDETGTWTLSRIAPLPEDQPGYAGIRDLIVHDGEVFAAADFGGIYRGVYDPQAPGRLRWTPENEMAGGPYGRPQRMEICDGVLYAAFGYSNQRQRGKQGGLFRRISGAKPRWERVYSWFENEGPFEFLMRGLTTVTGSDGKPALLGALERPPLPVIRRIEPTNEFAATDEINYENYFANVFDAWPNVGVFMTGAALNRFTPFTRPDDGRAVYLVTTFVIHPRSPQAGSNGAYFLVRNGPGSYDWGAINDPANQPDGVRLQGVRTIEPSPFPDEKGKVWYFGGFAADFAYVRDTAWIYKGTLQKGEEYKP
ncbi:EF-hand domain-containing protein [Kiritimatiella glycovorans]|uniref:Esterase, PHB depolymerase family n=1 Tax=Kiritimatiella glycovorans TaxID=1307763 RepID=A0A0G3EG56_9BACT|nr:EF-hand domain-containing protein [Kiritimatiella glycovorans]AKJ65436.1 esterase, PHB depolymerase family [Kiritimatiella glycovorans]